jgi:6-pyruvoyltetrahydropterin/6-carboxytetrahydropterin synthase
MAHRLLRTPGKCEAIHGHSWGIELSLAGPVDDNGLLCGINFSELKKAFRGMLDRDFDHRLLLNQDDPFAQPVISTVGSVVGLTLPGLQLVTGDPTTENFARLIGEWCRTEFSRFGIVGCEVLVNETKTNSAAWAWYPATEMLNEEDAKSDTTGS